MAEMDLNQCCDELAERIKRLNELSDEELARDQLSAERLHMNFSTLAEWTRHVWRIIAAERDRRKR